MRIIDVATGVARVDTSRLALCKEDKATTAVNPHLSGGKSRWTRHSRRKLLRRATSAARDPPRGASVVGCEPRDAYLAVSRSQHLHALSPTRHRSSTASHRASHRASFAADTRGARRTSASRCPPTRPRARRRQPPRTPPRRPNSRRGTSSARWARPSFTWRRWWTSPSSPFASSAGATARRARTRR